MKFKFHPLAFAGLFALSSLSIITSKDPSSYATFALMFWFVYFKTRKEDNYRQDERFQANLNKAGFWGFYTANMSLIFFFLLIGFSKIPLEIAIHILGGLFFLINLAFIVAFFRYEK